MDNELRLLERCENLSPIEIISLWNKRKRGGQTLSWELSRMNFEREEWTEKKWQKVVGKHTTWYIPVGSFPAESIHCAGGPRSQGYGGAHITFRLENGEEAKEVGPWHSNADSLFMDTGVDIRDRHRTFGVIALSTSYNMAITTFHDVIYKDVGPTEGNFRRVEKLAKELSTLLNVPLRFHSESAGGSYTDSVKPNET